MNTGSSYLLKHIIVHDFIKITVDKELELVSVTWQRQVSSEELKEGFYLAVEVAIMYSCKYWLSDARANFYLSRKQLCWLMRDLVSLLSLTEVKKIARIVPEDGWSLLYFGCLLDKIRKDCRYPLTFQAEAFTNPEEAWRWLLGQS